MSVVTSRREVSRWAFVAVRLLIAAMWLTLSVGIVLDVFGITSGYALTPAEQHLYSRWWWVTVAAICASLGATLLSQRTVVLGLFLNGVFVPYVTWYSFQRSESRLQVSCVMIAFLALVWHHRRDLVPLSLSVPGGLSPLVSRRFIQFVIVTFAVAGIAMLGLVLVPRWLLHPLSIPLSIGEWLALTLSPGMLAAAALLWRRSKNGWWLAVVCTFVQVCSSVPDAVAVWERPVRWIALGFWILMFSMLWMPGVRALFHEKT
jgi:hypothetical protein